MILDTLMPSHTRKIDGFYFLINNKQLSEDALKEYFKVFSLPRVPLQGSAFQSWQATWFPIEILRLCLSYYALFWGYRLYSWCLQEIP